MEKFNEVNQTNAVNADVAPSEAVALTGSSSKEQFSIAFKTFALDVGISTAIGFVGAFIYGFLTQSTDASALELPATIVGLGISIYAAYIMRIQHVEAEVKVLLYLICTGVLFGIFTSVAFLDGGLSIETQMAMLVGVIVAYSIGWYVADKELVKLPVVSSKWQKVFRVIGYITIAFSILTTIAFLVA